MRNVEGRAEKFRCVVIRCIDIRYNMECMWYIYCCSNFLRVKSARFKERC